jgi:myosin heavy subunit
MYCYLSTPLIAATHCVYERLSLGNITFEQGKDSESSKVAGTSHETLQHCAELLGVNIDMFTYSLTEKKVRGRSLCLCCCC